MIQSIKIYNIHENLPYCKHHGVCLIATKDYEYEPTIPALRAIKNERFPPKVSLQYITVRIYMFPFALAYFCFIYLLKYYHIKYLYVPLNHRAVYPGPKAQHSV